MSILNPTKEINVNKINCDGTFKVTLGLTGVPNISDNPADIILILDRSGSMNSSNKITNMKIGAKEQLDIITKATGGIIDEKIGGGSRVGLVTFSTDATLDVPLTTDAKVLNQKISEIIATGQTNHGAAFAKAVESFDPSSTNDKIIVMFTDGALNDGPDPIPITDAAKANGIEIYCIGVENTSLVIDKWASTPTDKYVAFSQNPTDLSKLFVDIGNRIATSGSTNGKITETLNDDFKITSIDTPTFGTVKQISDTVLEWGVNGIGNVEREEARLTFNVKHIGIEGGVKKVNKNIKYVDDEQNIVSFPDPTIEIDCSNTEEIVVPCPMSVDFSINGCEESATFNLNSTELESLGRIIELNTIIKNVCPGKKVAVAVKLMEIDELDREYPRGLKFFEIPAHTKEACIDIPLKCIRFVLPESLDVTGDKNSICNIRRFKAFVMANYIDTDYQCCKNK